jgi:hypothetical protein
MENNTFKCPKDGCGKNFRKENLLQVSNITIPLNIISSTELFYVHYITVACVASSSYSLIFKNYTVHQFLLYEIILKLPQMD